MRKIIFALLIFSQITQAQFKLNKTEYFTVSASIDPTSSFKEKGIDIVGEIEYIGIIYAKGGIESFSVLQGGYTDFHGAIGINFTSGLREYWRYYLGVRMATVFRDGSFAVNYGLESGIDYTISKNIFIGLRATLDKRYEQEVIFNWNPELKFSGFVRIGYRWNYRR